MGADTELRSGVDRLPHDREIMRGLFAKGYGREDVLVAMTAHLDAKGEGRRALGNYVKAVWREFHFPAEAR